MRAKPWPERPERSEQERETPRPDTTGLHLPAHVLLSNPGLAGRGLRQSRLPAPAPTPAYGPATPCRQRPRRPTAGDTGPSRPPPPSRGNHRDTGPCCRSGPPRRAAPPATQATIRRRPDRPDMSRVAAPSVDSPAWTLLCEAVRGGRQVPAGARDRPPRNNRARTHRGSGPVRRAWTQTVPFRVHGAKS